MLLKRADSHLSGARFVGHGTCRLTAIVFYTLRRDQSIFKFGWQAVTEHKNISHHENLQAMNDNQKPKSFTQNENHKVKNFAYTASKTRLPKRNCWRNAQPRDSQMSKWRSPKNICRQTEITLKNEKPKNNFAGKNNRKRDYFDFELSHRQMPNGLRYPQVGRRGQCLRCRKNLKPEKCS